MADTARRLPKILFRLTCSLLAFLILVVILTGVALRHGIQFDRINFGAITAKTINLSWQHKLEVHIDSLAIVSQPDSPKDLKRLEDFRDDSEKVVRFLPYFSKLTIDHCTIQGRTFSIAIDETEAGQYSFDMAGKEVTLKTTFHYENSRVLISIEEALLAFLDINITGNLRIIPQTLTAEGELHADFGKDFPIICRFTADRKHLSFSGEEDGAIYDIQPFVALFDLEYDTRKWFTDYLQGSRYHLHSFSGSFPWKSPEKILNTLNAEVRVDDTAYTFEQELPQIRAEYTDVTFANRILYISPLNPRYQGHEGKDSSVKIDFTDTDNILLTADIRSVTVANKSVADLLKVYDIPFPVRQLSGKTDTNVILVINLNSDDIDITGKFWIDEGTLRFNDQLYHVKNGAIDLKNKRLLVSRALFSQPELYKAAVTADVDLGKSEGTITIRPEQVTLPIDNSTLRLNPTGKPPIIHYILTAAGQTVQAEASHWLFDGHSLTLAPFSAPFNVETGTIDLSRLTLSSPTGIKALLSGKVAIDRLWLDLAVELQEFVIAPVSLEKSPLSLTVKYDQSNTLRMATAMPARFRINNTPLILAPVEILADEHHLNAVTGLAELGRYWSSPLSIYWDRKKHAAAVGFTTKDLPAPIEPETQNHFSILAPEIEAQFIHHGNDSIIVTCSDLTKVAHYSPLLNQLNLTAGTLSLVAPGGAPPFRFNGELSFHQQLLLENNQPISDLQFSGWLDNGEFTGTINKNILLTWADQRLDITAHNLGFDLPGIIEWIENLKRVFPGGDSKSSLIATFSGTDTFAQLKPKSRLLADRLDLHLSEGELLATLEHGPGRALFQLADGNFSLGGKNLNDRFMGALLNQSTFTGGNMSLTARGSFDDYTTVLEISDALLRDSLTVNTLVAALNTIPALLTFSLPDYNTKGLRIDSALLGLHFTKQQISLESLEIDSHDLQGAGKGVIDLTKKELDIDLKITTRGRKKLRKVPIVGYVMTGDEDDPTVNIKIAGSLDKPEVEYGLVKDIVTIPYNLLYRTLRLPVHLYESLESMAQ